MQLRGILALTSVLFLTGFAKPASAGVHLEPYVGYAMPKLTAGSTEEDLKGVIYGARLGYSIPMFAFGAEYMGGSLKDEDGDTGKPGDIGAFVSVEFPVMIRAFATYFVKSKVAFDTGDLEGSGFKAGIGFTPLPLLSVNIEYISGTYDEFDGTKLPTDYEVKGLALTVSLPLDI